MGLRDWLIAVNPLGWTRVPDLCGHGYDDVVAVALWSHLKFTCHPHYADLAALPGEGTPVAVSQFPLPGSRVKRNSNVLVIMERRP